MRKTAVFGPGGNSDAFRMAGYSSTVDAPMWLSKIGLDAYEYEAGNGLTAGASTPEYIINNVIKKLKGEI